MTPNAQADRGAFVHPALFYHNKREYLDALVPFITDGLEAEHPVLVAVPGPNLAILRHALGRSSRFVMMADMTEAGRNPGRILGQLLGGFADKHPHEPVRMVGEPIWPSRSEVEYPACVQHEALINHAFTDREVTVVCPYDAAHLDSSVLSDARRTHPVLWQTGLPAQDSTTYAPDAVWARYNEPLHSAAGAVTYTVRKLADLSQARAFASLYAQWFGLAAEPTALLPLIVTELATSSLTRADGPCRLALWRQDGHLVCEARGGGYLDDPLAGRRPYRRDTDGGLYVVNGVADLVRIHSTADKTTIHAYLRLKQAA